MLVPNPPPPAVSEYFRLDQLSWPGSSGRVVAGQFTVKTNLAIAPRDHVSVCDVARSSGGLRNLRIGGRRVALAAEVREPFLNIFGCKFLALHRVDALEGCIERCGVVAPHTLCFSTTLLNAAACSRDI